jgi:hypothetical protein
MHPVHNFPPYFRKDFSIALDDIILILIFRSTYVETLCITIARNCSFIHLLTIYIAIEFVVHNFVLKMLKCGLNVPECSTVSFLVMIADLIALIGVFAVIRSIQ